jgi:hypothetical protein
LIKDAKSYHYHKEKLSNLELLLELQHYGAATGLVDFSRDISFLSPSEISIVSALSIV